MHVFRYQTRQLAYTSSISTFTYSVIKPDSWYIYCSFRHARIPLSNQTAGIYIVHFDIHVFRYQTRQLAYISFISTFTYSVIKPDSRHIYIYIYIVHFDMHVFRYQTRQQAYISFISTFTYYVIS